MLNGSCLSSISYVLETLRIWHYLIPSRGICLLIDSPRWTLLSCFTLYTAVYYLFRGS